jgi:glutathione synthase/RimK-type ligase-like ATP-grasp enzyme
VTDAEREIVARLNRHLLTAGIRMAGIDLIGDFVTEVNALNPGGAFHTDRLNGTHLAQAIIAKLETEFSSRHTETIAWAPPAP